jgi:CubicO group peptidase (beta-lactamase class C family)
MNHHEHNRDDRTPPQDLATTITALMARRRVPGLSIAVTDSQRLLYAAGFGSSDLATGRSATADTSYLWFSMSKIVTATAALRLVDEGLLDLDAPVRTFVPTFTGPRGTADARVRNLLDHTSGLGNPLPLRWVLPADRQPAEVEAFAERLLARHGTARRPAGGPARYSNVNYLLLAEVVARAAGRPFTTYVREAVLDPVGMTATGFDVRPDAEQATGYVRLPRGLTPVLRAALPRGLVGRRFDGFVALSPFRVAGAGYGGVIGSATDAARLLRLHLADGVIDGHRVLRAETARLMREIRTPGRPFDLGLGWFRPAAERDATPTYVEHWGTGGGFWNAMRLYPDLDLGVVVMANTTQAYGHGTVMSAVRTAFRP